MKFVVLHAGPLTQIIPKNSRGPEHSWPLPVVPLHRERERNITSCQPTRADYMFCIIHTGVPTQRPDKTWSHLIVMINSSVRSTCPNGVKVARKVQVSTTLQKTERSSTHADMGGSSKATRSSNVPAHENNLTITQDAAKSYMRSDVPPQDRKGPITRRGAQSTRDQRPPGTAKLLRQDLKALAANKTIRPRQVRKRAHLCWQVFKSRRILESSSVYTTGSLRAPVLSKMLHMLSAWAFSDDKSWLTCLTLGSHE